MIKILTYYMIVIIILGIIGILPILVANFTYKRYPNSKLANFFRKYIVSDKDLEDYD